jgi:hypothetical protein
VKVQRPDALPTVARDLVILRRGIQYYQNTLSQMASGLGVANSDDIMHLLRSWAEVLSTQCTDVPQHTGAHHPI